jgi:thiamine-phosphate pyrophosphorylase
MKEHFGLYLILTDPVTSYETCATAAVECGIRYLQLRIKNAPRAFLFETAQRLREITRGSETRFIINDDLEVAMQSDADGIHLGQGDLSIAQARRTWARPDKLFGLSTHNEAQIQQAEQLSPDYIGVGPVFPTPTKPDTAPALGTEETGRLMRRTPLTTVAIGGVNAENLPHLLQAGMDNFCVVSAVNQAEDPTQSIRQLQKIWKRHNF